MLSKYYRVVTDMPTGVALRVWSYRYFCCINKTWKECRIRASLVFKAVFRPFIQTFSRCTTFLSVLWRAEEISLFLSSGSLCNSVLFSPSFLPPHKSNFWKPVVELPMWPGFNFGPLSYVGWVCCWFPPCFEGFSPGCPVFPPVQKTSPTRVQPG